MRRIFLNILEDMEQKAASMDGQLTEAARRSAATGCSGLHEIRAREYEEAMIGKKWNFSWRKRLRLMADHGM